MERALILFCGVYEIFDEFTEQVAVAADRRGIPRIVLNRNDDWTELAARISGFHEQYPGCMAILFNNIILPLEVDGENLWDRLHIPVYDVLVDPPIHFDQYLRQPIRELRLTCADRGHVAFVQRMYPNVNRVAFLPHGGIETPGWKPYRDREIDVLFTGHCQDEREYGVIDFLPDEGADFYSAVIDVMLRDPSLPTEEAVWRIIREQQLSLTEHQEFILLNDAAISIEWNVRRAYKLEIIRQLGEAGIRVDVIGDRYEEPDIEWPETIRFHPSTSMEELRRATGNAKISLNIMPWFKDGSHDRVFNAMLNGAVCVTDTTKYLQERFSHGRELVFYDLADIAQLIVNVKWLLEHPDESAVIAERGYMTALVHDTWGNRLDTLLQFMDKEEANG